MKVRFREQDYRVAHLGEAWAIEVANAWYFLSAGGVPDRAVDLFLEARVRPANVPKRPAFMASEQYPLLLKIDAELVRAWPAFAPRGTGAKTYIQPALGERVATTRGPVWMFAARGKKMSEGGDVTPGQDVGDVAALARAWLGKGE